LPRRLEAAAEALLLRWAPGHLLAARLLPDLVGNGWVQGLVDRRLRRRSDHHDL